MISLILFDMDGVLLESADIKTEVFRRLFSIYPDFIEEIIRYHLENQGVSRYEKIPYIFQHILHQPLDETLRASLYIRFEDYVMEAMINAPLVSGCEEFLNTFSHLAKCAVVSAAPEQEVIQILTGKGIADHFEMILGSPNQKTDNILHILQAYDVSPAGSVMIGDSLTDYHAARSVGCRFIGRVPPGKESPFLGKTNVEYLIKDLHDLGVVMAGIL